jgi:hypothetical protein
VGAEFIIDIADGHGPVKFDFVESVDEGEGAVGDKEFDEAFVMMAKVEGCDGGVGELGNGVDSLAESGKSVNGEAVGGLKFVSEMCMAAMMGPRCRVGSKV